MRGTVTLCADAIAALDRALHERPDTLYDDLTRAARCLVALRDALIADRRAGLPEADAHLQRANALLSLVVGGEYPVAGLHRDRLQQARDGLDRLRQDTLAAGG